MFAYTDHEWAEGGDGGRGGGMGSEGEGAGL